MKTQCGTDGSVEFYGKYSREMFPQPVLSVKKRSSLIRQGHFHGALLFEIGGVGKAQADEIILRRMKIPADVLRLVGVGGKTDPLAAEISVEGEDFLLGISVIQALVLARRVVFQHQILLNQMLKHRRHLLLVKGEGGNGRLVPHVAVQIIHVTQNVIARRARGGMDHGVVIVSVKGFRSPLYV